MAGEAPSCGQGSKTAFTHRPGIGYSIPSSATASGDPAALVAASKDAVIGTTIVMFTYALLVPVPTGRAWRAIAMIAACPVATEALLVLTHADVFRLARRLAAMSECGSGSPLRADRSISTNRGNDVADR